MSAWLRFYGDREQFNIHLAMVTIEHEGGPELEQEQRAEDPAVGEGAAVVLVDGPTAAEEGDEEDCEAKEDEEERSGEEAIAEEVKVLGVGHPDHHSGHDQDAAGNLSGGSLCSMQKSEARVKSNIKFAIFCRDWVYILYNM